MTQLRGIVDRITFQNEENGYTVARLQVEGIGRVQQPSGDHCGRNAIDQPGRNRGFGRRMDDP